MNIALWDLSVERSATCGLPKSVKLKQIALIINPKHNGEIRAPTALLKIALCVRIERTVRSRIRFRATGPICPSHACVIGTDRGDWWCLVFSRLRPKTRILNRVRHVPVIVIYGVRLCVIVCCVTPMGAMHVRGSRCEVRMGVSVRVY